MNNTAKHMPGPLTAFNCTNGHIFKRWRLKDSAGDVIAEIRDDIPGDRQIEYAHLFAAALAMYEALQMVATTLYDMADSAGDVPEWNESGELYELSRTVRAALAQAEGKG